MSKSAYTIAAALAALILISFASNADGAPRPRRDPKKTPGSKVRQLLLKQALDKHGETLLAELNRNKKVWGSMGPEELRNLRDRYYAFLKQDENSQIALMEAAEKFHSLSARQRQSYLKRAAWLKKVVAGLTPAQRKALKKLTPAERAKRLLELKAKLVDTQPAASQPKAQPTSQPASETTPAETTTEK